MLDQHVCWVGNSWIPHIFFPWLEKMSTIAMKMLNISLIVPLCRQLCLLVRTLTGFPTSEVSLHYCDLVLSESVFLGIWYMPFHSRNSSLQFLEIFLNTMFEFLFSICLLPLWKYYLWISFDWCQIILVSSSSRPIQFACFLILFFVFLVLSSMFIFLFLSRCGFPFSVSSLASPAPGLYTLQWLKVRALKPGVDSPYRNMPLVKLLW